MSHPIFEPYRGALERLIARGSEGRAASGSEGRAASGAWPDAAQLDALAGELGVAPRNAVGLPIRFVDPATAPRDYEMHIYSTGRVPTRPGNLHDLFNALVWLRFPRLKAALNAMHAAHIPHEGGRRSRLRDLLTLLDEGGALVACADPALAGLVRGFRWRELFWERRAQLERAMRVLVVGHAVLEKALAPWPGITCKAVFFDVEPERIGVPGREPAGGVNEPARGVNDPARGVNEPARGVNEPARGVNDLARGPQELARGPQELARGPQELARELDERAARWVTALAPGATPRDLPPLPVFGLPGWHPGGDDPAFYDDARYFRALRASPASEPGESESL